MIKEIFQAGELKTGLPESGEYIFVEKCPNAYITVRAQTALGVREYIMRERDTNNVPQGEEFTSLAVVNTGERMGEVIIRTGFGTFTKSNDHQKVSIDTEINLPSNISFSSPQPIYPSSTAMFNAKVQNWPAEYPVVFKGIQKVEVTNIPAVQKVEVTNPAGRIKPETHALPKIVIDGEKSIAANPNRQGVIVIAPKTNTGTVTIAGFIPLEAGGSTTIPATNVLSVTGNKGDVLLVGEVR